MSLQKRTHKEYYWVYLIALKLGCEVYNSKTEIIQNVSSFFKQNFADSYNRSSTELQLFEYKDFKLLACRFKKTLFLAIRGTDNFINILRDVDFKLTNFGMGNEKVHSGFKSFFREGLSKMDKAIDWAGSKVDKIVFTGHSLGGATAQLAYFHYSWINKDRTIKKNKSTDCVTLGSPRVGCNNFKKTFELMISPITRYGRFVATDKNDSKKDDLVTTLPPFFTHPVNCQRISIVSDKINITDSDIDQTKTTNVLETHDNERYFNAVKVYLEKIQDDKNEVNGLLGIFLILLFAFFLSLKFGILLITILIILIILNKYI